MAHINPIGKKLAVFTQCQRGGAKQNLGHGHTGTHNRCPNRAIGMRVVCIWKDIHNIITTSAILAILRNMVIKIFVTIGLSTVGILKH